MLPEGFVFLDATVPGFCWDAKYAAADNLTGAPLNGYNVNRVVGSCALAEALAAAAEYFAGLGYRLYGFDAYRPQRAVKHFVRWAYDEDDKRMQEEFYPEFKKKILMVDQGYIARNSSHCRGSAVDLTLTDMEGNPLDMGTGFDYFGKKAWHGAKGITEEQENNRELLKSVMENHNFRCFEKEWWHYKLLGEPFIEKGFDFPVK